MQFLEPLHYAIGFSLSVELFSSLNTFDGVEIANSPASKRSHRGLSLKVTERSITIFACASRNGRSPCCWIIPVDKLTPAERISFVNAC
jgi:hypothetical protein